MRNTSEKDSLLLEKNAVTRNNGYLPFDKKSMADIIVIEKTWFLI
jgi:hypothetical protein